MHAIIRQVDLQNRLRYFAHPSRNLCTGEISANIYQMIIDSPADCSISLSFGIEFDHVTSDVLQMFKVIVKGQTSSQRENVV